MMRRLLVASLFAAVAYAGFPGQVYPTMAARNQRSARSTVTGIAKARREKRKRRARK